MYFVGVDLAWGDRKPTGLAVLDDDGRLVHVSAARTDDEIADALAAYVEGDCLVAIDAPLIVTNPTGNRPAEAALNADFARFDAGAHPSNTGKSEFRDGTRGARVAGRLGLDMNPRSGRSRRAIEVYPHPATVALFRLGRTLKYKNKAGREVADLRSELLVLVGLLEGMVTAEPPLLLDGPDVPGRGCLAGAAGGGRGRDPQERAAGGRGPGRRRALRLRRPPRRATARRHHDVRRLRRPATSSPPRCPPSWPRPRAASGPGPSRSTRPRRRSGSTPPSSRCSSRRPSCGSGWSPRCSTTPASTTSASSGGRRA